MSQSNRSLLYTTATLGLAVIVIAGLIIKRQEAINYSEQDLIEKLEADGVQGDAHVVEVDFDTPTDAEVDAQVLLVARQLQGRIGVCADRWPAAPDTVRIHIQTGASGRLDALDVEAAPDPVERCLLNVLQEGRFPRDVRGFTALPLRIVR